MSIYITKKGEKRKVNISATDVQLLDIDGNFKNKNLEDALIELSSVGGGGNAPHDHDDRYYTESEIDTMLSKKVDKDKAPAMSSGTFKPVFIDAETREPIELYREDLLIGNYTVIGNICFFSIEANVCIDANDRSKYAGIKLGRRFYSSNDACMASMRFPLADDVSWANCNICGDTILIITDYGATPSYYNIGNSNGDLEMTASGFFFIQQ